jgi:hypothetical protein
MSSTDQAQEPTMEEILASIRRIISDDTVAKPAETEAVAEAEVELSQDDVDNIDFDGAVEVDETADVDFAEVDSDLNEDDDDDDVLELTDIVAEEPAEESAADIDFESLDIGDDDFDVAEREDVSDDIEFVDVEIDLPEPETTFDEPFAAPEPEAQPEPESLLSTDTDASVAAAFGQLASTLLARDGNTRTLEELVQEMLKPMLKSWLDENLPSVVEGLVRQEIERVARRGGR